VMMVVIVIVMVVTGECGDDGFDCDSHSDGESDGCDRRRW
jgi:hypothetical protein